MASTQSPEASEIRRRGRQRLIGAVAIALLLIVFVPMVLDSDPRPARQEPDLKIPPRENPAPLPAPTPAPAEAPKVAVVQPKATAVPAPPPTAAVAPTPAPTPAPKAAAAAAAPSKEGFAIQVGAFADESKAQQLKEKLAASNLTAYTESAGSLTRIRVGPFTTRDAAEKTIPAVRLIVPDAKVVSLP